MKDSNGSARASSDDLAAAAGVLLRAPVRGRPEARFVSAGDSFVIVADQDSMAIAEVIRAVAVRIGAHAEVVSLDDRASLPPGARSARPHRVLPSSIRIALARARCVAYVASAPSKEHAIREQISGIAAALK